MRYALLLAAGLFLVGTISVQAQVTPEQVYANIRVAMCQQNWAEALRQTDTMLQFDLGQQRQSFVDLRGQLASYASTGAQFDAIPGCNRSSSTSNWDVVQGSTQPLRNDTARPAQSIIARSMSFRTSNRQTFLIGQLVNQSDQTLYVNTATFTFTRSVDGRTEIYATIEVPILQTIAPGRAGSVDDLVDVREYQTTTIRLESVQAWQP